MSLCRESLQHSFTGSFFATHVGLKEIVLLLIKDSVGGVSITNLESRSKSIPHVVDSKLKFRTYVCFDVLDLFDSVFGGLFLYSIWRIVLYSFVSEYSWR